MVRIEIKQGQVKLEAKGALWRMEIAAQKHNIVHISILKIRQCNVTILSSS